ncbi:MAG: hypothetical protein JSR39_08060 [Verrucomicrobia bacterium]|nr:hypothetical protein [Verrucomicrobiota bacterium]
MNGQKLFFAAFLSCCCTFSYAQQSSGAICDTEIYPKPSPDESVLPSFADADTSGDGSGGSTTDPSATPSKPQGDKEYFPQSSSSSTPKGDKEYFPQSTAPTTPKGDKEYFPPESTAPTTPAAPATPKSEKEVYPESTVPTTPITPKNEKEYYPSASSNQNKSNSKKASR